MSSRKKSTTSSDSSSGSSSGSSSTSGSSSGSDSNSSSSDSDSSSSQEQSTSRRNSTATVTASQQPIAAVATDSKSTPAILAPVTPAAASQPTTNNKKPAPTAQPATSTPARRISQNKSKTGSAITSAAAAAAAATIARSKQTAATSLSLKTASTSNNTKTTGLNAGPKSTAPSTAANPLAPSNSTAKPPNLPLLAKPLTLSNSSDDDDDDNVLSSSNHTATVKKAIVSGSTSSDNNKKKTQPLTERAKAAASNGSAAVSVPISTGGKAPPAVVKQQQQQLHGLANANLSKAGSGNIKTKPPSSKSSVATNSNSSVSVKADASKPTATSTPFPKSDSKSKKSIFSSDNTSGSDDDDDSDEDSSGTKKTTKARHKRPTASAMATASTGGKTKPPSAVQRAKAANRPQPPPAAPPQLPAKPKAVEKIVPKSSAESESGSSSSSSSDEADATSSSSDSDSDDSSGDSSPPSKRAPAAAKRAAAAATAKSVSRAHNHSGIKQSPEANRHIAASVAKADNTDQSNAIAIVSTSITAPNSATTAPLAAVSTTSSNIADSTKSTASTQKVAVRKLTRSSSTRKSKHLTAIFNPAKASDTDSGAEAPGGEAGDPADNKAQRDLSKSPVKRAPGTAGHIIGNGSNSQSKSGSKTKSNSRTSQKPSTGNGSPQKRSALPATAAAVAAAAAAAATAATSAAAAAVAEERRCPIDGCDSSGHLAGRLAKHFTPEACPLWHGVTLAETRVRAEERQRRDAERQRAGILYEPDMKQPTVEQKAYQMRIRDVRSKFVPMPVSPSVRPPPTSYTYRGHRGGGADAMRGGEPQHEPSLTGLVSDYDLQLFREAQAAASERIEDELRVLPAGKGTKYIVMGRHNMEVWYQSPYPDDVTRLPKLFLCEFCLRYQKSEVGMKRHAAKCVWRHPPGDEIYRKQKLGVWQVDGKRHKPYCQNLCLLAKFFLDHKTLYYDVEPFLFYVMTLADSEGCHTVGYFSKEKNSFLNYNVSCILTLPPYQRKGYGRLLIDFSYLLTRVEGKIGSPEKPLSDLGLISYRSYWKDVLLDYLCSRSGTTLSIKDVSQEMAINSYDIVSTLQALGMMKYWKGKHIILKKQDVLEEYEERIKSRGAVIKIDPSCLRWTPFVMPTPPGPS